eukprot:UN1446
MGSAQAMMATHATSNPTVAFLLMGIGFALAVCSLWVVLPGLINAVAPAEMAKEIEGVATGMAYATLAAAQFTSNYVVGVIKDSGSYKMVCMWFVVIAGLGLLSLLASMACFSPTIVGVASQSSSDSPVEEQADLCVGKEEEGDDDPKVSGEAITACMFQEDYYAP